MIQTFKLLCLSLLLFAAEAQAWDYTTSNPCDTPVAHRGTADGLPPDPPAATPYSTAIDLNLPLTSYINADAYNADLSRSEIDVGAALVTQEGAYLNVLGNDVPAASTTTGNPTTTGCR